MTIIDRESTSGDTENSLYKDCGYYKSYSHWWIPFGRSSLFKSYFHLWLFIFYIGVLLIGVHHLISGVMYFWNQI